MHKVIKAFHDLQDPEKDGYHFYNTGDTYPRTGMKPTAERVGELSGADNAQKEPLIKEVKAARKTK